MAGKQRLIVLFGLAVSLLFLYLAFRNLHPEDVLRSLSTVQVGWLLLGALLFIPSLLAIAWRWGFLLRALRPVPLSALTSIVSIGYMGNNVYPLRAGEALRIYLLRRDHAVPITGATITILVERVFDGLVMLTFVVLGLLLADVQSEELRTVVNVAAPIFLGAIAAFFGLALFPQILRRMAQLVARLLPGRLGELAQRISEDVLAGLEGLRSPAQLAGTVFASYLTWGIQILIYWVVMWGFGLDLDWTVAMLVVGVVNLAGLIPASPGQIGVYEFFVSLVLQAVGVPADAALAYALGVHVVIWLPVTLAGFALLVRRGLGWSAITHARELEARST